MTELIIKAVCSRCSGDGNWPNPEIHPITGEVTEPSEVIDCIGCEGLGYVHLHSVNIDAISSVLDDILDKCNDTLDKCNDIFEKVNE